MLGLARARLALIALAAGGCQTSTPVTTVSPSVTLITADPAAFQGSAVCGTTFFFYTVTLTDVASGVPLLRSGLVPCTQQVSFSAAGATPIVPGHYYIAAIEGFDRNDVVLDAGIPVDSAGNAVAPRWFSQCGEFVPSPDASDSGEDASTGPSPNPLTLPVQAKEQTEVFIRGCTPFAAFPEPDGSVETGSPAPDVSVESGSTVDATSDTSTAFDGAIQDAGPDSAIQDAGPDSAIDDVGEASPGVDDAPQETNDAAFGTDDATLDTDAGVDSMSPGQDP